jgi:hypothetical protein
MKTAVEWLQEMFNNSEIPNSSMLFKQAKEMEKEQISKAFENGELCTLFKNEDTSVKYYNKTFKK